MTRRAPTTGTGGRPGGSGADSGAATGGWQRLLVRPLAEDDSRAEFWVRHTQVGVAITEVAALLIGVYAVLADRPHVTGLLVTVAVLAVGSPALLLVPVRRIVHDLRGPLFFYAWSGSLIAAISVMTLVDGGAGSPLSLLFVLTLTFAGLAYPPLGVALVGGVMLGAYLALVTLAAPPPVSQAAVTAGVLALYTTMTCWVSHNQWQAQDQQHLLGERLAALAETDALTGCLNRGAVHRRLADALRVRGAGRPLSVLLVDLDGFKQVNDRHGHAAGDRVLVDIARALRGAARETDSVGRLGGDEFLVLLPDTAAPDAWAAAHRIAEAVRRAGGARGVTASIGAATAQASEAASEVLERADRAMYEAKRAGRDTTCAAP